MRHVDLGGISVVLGLGLLAIGLSVVRPAVANETDQFLPPPNGQGITDIQRAIHIVHYRVIDQTIKEANRRIGQALRRGDSETVARWQRPHMLADGIRGRFGPGFIEMIHFEDALRRPSARRMTSEDQLVAWRNPVWIYFLAHAPVDPRNSVLLFQSSTINIGGVYHGVDKWGHFHDLGHIYYKNYLGRRRRGASHAAALAGVVREFSRGAISESVIIGRLATGVQANADLASNYAGMKFYINLTEPVRIGERELPPLVVRRGNYWVLNEHVRPEGNFITPFVTHHWNEALNPGRFELGMRVGIARRIRGNRQAILDFYQQHQGLTPTRSTYEQLAEELTTFYGEDYGYLPVADHEATIARLCFDDELASSQTRPVAKMARPEGRTMEHRPVAVDISP